MKQIEFNLNSSERMKIVLLKKEDYKQQKAAEKSETLLVIIKI
jgi:hypothetical protein